MVSSIQGPARYDPCDDRPRAQPSLVIIKHIDERSTWGSSVHLSPHFVSKFCTSNSGGLSLSSGEYPCILCSLKNTPQHVTVIFSIKRNH